MRPLLRHLLLCCALAQSPATLAAGTPACTYVEAASVALEYTGSSLDITMPGRIDGIPVRMLVDTGSGETFLTRTWVARQGAALRHTGRWAQGVGGSSRIRALRVKEFSAGPTSPGKGYMPVIDRMGFAPSYDAIVGAPFLLQTDLEFSLAEKTLRFFRPRGCEDSFLGYWDENTMVIPFEYHRKQRDNPFFTVMLNGHKLLAMIDSGATTTSVDLRAAERAGLKKDGSAMRRHGEVRGVGEDRVARWIAIVDSFTIGQETVRNARLAVIDTNGQLPVDVLLGADFLRAHRVLFAMSQKKLYVSYVGGEPFGQRDTLEPWMRQEAEAGNADAQFAVAERYHSGAGVPRDDALAASWLGKAADGGNGHASLTLGRQLLLAGQYTDAAARLQAAVERLPHSRIGPVWLYLARLHGGQAEQARRELEASLARADDSAEDDWPTPVAEYFLGRIDSATLLERAAGHAEQGVLRQCLARAYMAELERPGEAGSRQAGRRCGAAGAAPAG